MMEEPSKEEPVSYSVEEWTLSGEEYQARTGRKRPESHNRNPEVLIGNIESWILLNAEAMTTAEHKSVQLGTTVILVIASGVFCSIFVLKWPPGVAGQDIDLYWIRHKAILILNVIFASLCLALLLPVTVKILRGWIICHSLVAKGAYFWAPKRKRITLFALLRQVAQTINVCAWLIQNAYLLGKGCAWFDLFPSYLTLFQWTCFNFSYVLDLVYADCLNPWLDDDGRPQHNLPGVTKGLKYSPDPLLMDEPPLRALCRHAPKFLLGIIFEGTLVFFAVYLGVAGGVSTKSINDTNRSLQSQPQCSEQPYNCTKGAAYIVVTSMLMAMVVLHAILCFFYIEQAQDRLRTAGPYCQWERAHKMLGLLQQTCGWVTTLGLASTTGLLPSYTSCSGFVIAWFGVLPLQITASAVAAVNAHMFYPRVPKPGDVVVQAWLRELAWTQEDVGGMRATMAAKLPALKERLEQEPIFCFDVAAKLLLWSDLVYSYEEKAAEGEEPYAAVLHASGWCGCWAACCAAKEVGEVKPAPAVPSSGQIAAVHPPGSDQAAQPQQRDEAAAGEQNGSLHSSQAPERQATSDRPLEQVMEGSQAADASGPRLPGTRPPVAAIQSFRLSPDGTLTQQQTDAKVKLQAEVEVASGDELELALRLFGLTNFEILEELTLQTKVLLGWSSTCIVLAFRGTAHAINAWNDIKVWRMPHPPVRGSYWLRSRPMVHGGFLKSWMANGLQARVLALVREIVAQASVSSSDFKVYVTGHSLGGALATLAAMDIGRELHLPGITCHTFGAPRTGSHVFAREYEQLVPNTWHVINDKDAVPRVGKIGWLYKRPGQRVLLNRYGDVRVRPDMFQVSLGQEGFSVREHYLSSYRAAFVSILKAQLMPLRGMNGGEAAVRAFAADRHMNALCTYLGADLRRLLQTPQEKITITVRRRPFELNPFSRYGFVNGLSILGCRMTAFIFGEAFTDSFKALMHRFFPKVEDSDVSETEVPLDWSQDSQASDPANISSIP